MREENGIENSCFLLQQPQISNTAARNFARHPGDRHKSLEERKKALIENARRKYMEKHGMM